MNLTCELIVAPMGEGFVAVPISGGEDAFRGIVQLNDSGAMIVNGLIQGKDATEIADQILAEFENVTQATALDAVQSMVDKLKSVGLIEE